jgi:hypothetical protein
MKFQLEWTIGKIHMPSSSPASTAMSRRVSVQTGTRRGIQVPVEACGDSGGICRLP